MTTKEIDVFKDRLTRVRELVATGECKMFERNPDSAIQHLTVAVIHLKDIVTDFAAIRDQDKETISNRKET